MSWPIIRTTTRLYCEAGEQVDDDSRAYTPVEIEIALAPSLADHIRDLKSRVPPAGREHIRKDAIIPIQDACTLITSPTHPACLQDANISLLIRPITGEVILQISLSAAAVKTWNATSPTLDLCHRKIFYGSNAIVYGDQSTLHALTEANLHSDAECLSMLRSLSRRGDSDTTQYVIAHGLHTRARKYMADNDITVGPITMAFLEAAERQYELGCGVQQAEPPSRIRSSL